MKDVCLAVVQVLGRLNPFPVRTQRRGASAYHKRRDPSLPHWPAAARWWHSRLKLIGPHKEKTELFLFPISEATGLHHVHPTWAGTFVLAALVAMFPGINFVLLDSDCLPVTLFEVEDL